MKADLSCSEPIDAVFIATPTSSHAEGLCDGMRTEPDGWKGFALYPCIPYAFPHAASFPSVNSFLFGASRTEMLEKSLAIIKGL